jgi:hypothetical protein
MTHLVVVGIVDVDDLLKTLDLCSLFGNSLDIRSSDKASNSSAQLHGSAHSGKR